MKKISVFKPPIQNIYNPTQKNISEIFEIITKDKENEKLISELRAIKDKKARNEFKTSKLLVATFSGTFTKRKLSGLIEHSSLVCIDIDNLNIEQMEQVRYVLGEINYLFVGYFISPSGNGYKILFKVDAIKYSQAQNYIAGTNFLQSATSLPASFFDTSCKDVSRACFISSDNYAYLNKAINNENDFKELFTLDTDNWINLNEETKNINNEMMNFIPILKGSNLDFEHKDDKSNFNILLSMVTRNKGEYKVGNRHTYIHTLAAYGNLFGMSENILIQYSDNYFENNIETNLIENRFETDELIVTIKDTYKRYAAQFSTWGIEENSKIETPLFPQILYENLPQLIASPTSLFNDGREKDIFLLGMLGVLSSWIPKVGGIYDSKIISANLFIVISAPASSGKGVLIWTRRLANGVSAELKNKFTKAFRIYETELHDFDKAKKENKEAIKPIKPLKEKFVIAGNISSAAIISNLSSNKSFGLIFESETDSLTNTLNNKDWGNFNDVLRKSFHNETVSYSRKKDDEDIEIVRPYLSMVLSGTPSQVLKLVSSIENGFFSRILFYDFPNKNNWKDVFEKKNENLEKYFEGYSLKLENLLGSFLYDKLDSTEDISLFEFTEKQKLRFNTFFADKQNDLSKIYGDDIIASVRRLGVCFFRLAMIFSTMRLIENTDYKAEIYKKEKKIICADIDYENIELMINTLLLHTLNVFSQVKKLNRNKNFSRKKDILIENLPVEFNRGKFIELAEFIGIKEKTAESYINQYISQGLLARIEHNNYKKIS